MSTTARMPLNRNRVLTAAVALADANGLDALSMRRLGQALGVEAMSLYNHVANKDDILDGIVDAVVAEIPFTSIEPTQDWQAAMREQVLLARQVMLRHPWAPRLIETRTTMTPAFIRYFDAVVGILRQGGFSLELAHHAMHVLGSRGLGFNQELFDEDSEDMGPEQMAVMMQQLADFPYVAEMAMSVTHEGGLGGCDDDVEFAFGLDLILEGLERRRRAS